MSTFNELLHAFKEACDEKDREIERLNDRIAGLENQYKTIRNGFLKGHYEQLKWYFGEDK
jgi:hypothetical protein